MIVLTLISGGVNYLASWVLQNPTIDFILYPEAFESNLLGIMLTSYPFELATLIAIGALMTLVGFMALISVARIAKGIGFVDSVNDSIKEFGKSFGLTIIAITGFLIFGVAFSAALALSELNDLLSQILFIIFAIVFFVTFIKFIFVIPAIIDKDTKKAVVDSWKFTDKRFWKTIALVAIAFALGYIGMQILLIIGAILPVDAYLAVSIIGEAFLSTFFIAAITNYYYQSK
jgi:uncharacterized membrane protein